MLNRERCENMLTKEEVLFQKPAVSFGTVNSVKSGPVNGLKEIKVNHVNPIGINNGDVLKTTKSVEPCYKYVHSKVTLYYNSRIELKWRRSLHYCQTCENGDEKGLKVPCGSIHYGMCLPVSAEVAQRLSPKVPVANKKLSKHSSHITGYDAVYPAISSHHHHPSTVQTISNGSSAKDKDSFKKDILDHRLTDGTGDRDLNKENTNLNTVQKNIVITDSNANRVKEIKSKRRDTSKQIVTSVISNANIPKFHFPFGRPGNSDSTDEVLLRVSQEFSKLEGGKAFNQHMPAITKTCGLPLYWKCPLFCAAGGNKQGFITYQMFSTMWKRIHQSCHDRAAQFVMLIAKPGSNYLDNEDFVPLIQDVVDTHPGLTFLLEAPEFHSRYVNTVIARIFYCINRSWTGRITIQELRKSNFLQILQLLEEEDDINQINDYFSYEHFYVIYCKFWELDKDHDLFIDRSDLARHNEHAMSLRMIDRIFSGAVTRGKTFQEGKMSYPEFVWFLMSEEDKKHPTSIEYWFRCMDLDGDGYISMYEMEYFYEEQMQKMEAYGIERLPFEDCLCQMLDLVQPEENMKIALKDLKRCKMANIFFDTFMNLDKFLENEQKDPFTNLRDLDSDTPEPTDWEKYAAEEYEILVAEEGANEQEDIHYEDDFEPDDDEQGQGHDDLTNSLERPTDPIKRTVITNSGKQGRTIEDDIYDFSKSSTY